MKNTKSKSRRASAPVIILSVLLVVILSAVGVLAYTVLTDPYDCRIAPGVTVGSVDVSGMSKKEAKAALETALDESLNSVSLAVHLPQEELVFSPEETGVQIRVRDAVNDAYAFGRKDTSGESQLPLLPYLEVNEDAIRAKLEAYASRWNTELSQPVWTLEGNRPELSTKDFDANAQGQTLVLTMGVPSLHLDIDPIYDQILAAYDNSISLCAAGEFAITPEAEPEELAEQPDIQAIWEEISVAAENDSLDMEKYTFVHGSYGYGFDTAQAQELISAAAPGETIRIPLTITEPEILGEGVYFRDVLGHCETKHTNDENRNTNLKLLCQALDGVILQPGDVFSFNGTVGERTEEKGYKPATAYSGTKMIKDIGGGVCQGSTTIYNCALLADLEIVERVCHGATVGYITLGLDAAVNWNTQTDLKFKNNFNFPMMIKAEVSDGYVRMKILGTDEKDYYIEMRCGFGEEGDVKHAVSYKCKFDKITGEPISKEREAFSTYYKLD